MTPTNTLNARTGEAIAQVQDATAAKKCWTCGCFHSSVKVIWETLPDDSPEALKDAIEAARDTLQGIDYDCLGCEVCYPALAINALEIEADACPTEEVEERVGWPPLPGDYSVSRYTSSVAVCTLTDGGLSHRIASERSLDVAISGTLQTENLGIERVILNVLANPNIRFLILCGQDSRNTVGHLPGQSMVALSHNGLDESGRIIDALGKRPLIRNISKEAVEHFRRTVEVVDLVGSTDLVRIGEAIRTHADRRLGPAEPFEPERVVRPIQGYIPDRMTSDPAGYFVVYVDRERRCLSLEHYGTNGVINAVIDGRNAAELSTPAVERGFVSRLDHAAYLGKELARAEQALLLDTPYVQDAAPEHRTTESRGCGCESTSGGCTQ